jgi:YtkA-like
VSAAGLFKDIGVFVQQLRRVRSIAGVVAVAIVASVAVMTPPLTEENEMRTLKGTKSLHFRAGMLALVMAAAVAFSACGHLMAMTGKGARRPAASEFGFGPRSSTLGRFVGTLESDSALRVRQLQTVRVIVRDSNGAAVDAAAIRIDGGMPQHGHGLPTRPRVSRNLGNGAYEVEGVRFNMGGWWEFKVVIETAAGADTITFNLDL